MARNYCSICIQEIGLFAYSKEYEGGKRICKECAIKSGIIDSKYKDEVPFETVKEWILHPEKRVEFEEKKQREEEEARQRELERQEEERLKKEEEKQKELERQEEERRIREEEQRVAEEKAREREKKLFPDGRVRVSIQQVSFTHIGATFGSGNALDSYLQKLQNQGCRIINVTCVASGENNNYIQAVVVYRMPPEDLLD